MKKLWKLTLAAGLLLAALPLLGFTDLPEEHWAYPAVTELVEDGTVNGYEDRTFQPDAQVTRAELVKMVGYRTQETRNDYIADLSRLHWGYDYLLHSPLRLINSWIYPDQVITREQVAQYLYDCYGNGEASYPPSLPLRGVNYPTEVGWVYEHGMMVGDDGINLRLADGLTRAEAATLVVNARRKLGTTTDFVSNLSGEALAQVYNDSGLFDDTYDKDATLTNGQLARAACRLRSGEISGIWYEEQADFQHEYANDLKMMEPVLGEGRISAEFADAPALPEDAFAMLAYGMISKLHTPVAYGTMDGYYVDAKVTCSGQNAALTFSFGNGIRPFAGGVLRSGTPVTKETVAAILFQYDQLWGLHTSVAVKDGAVTYRDEPMRFTDLPANAGLFQAVLKSVPNAVYEMPFRSLEGEEIAPEIPPRSNFGFFIDLRTAFASYLNGVGEWLAESYGIAAKLTYYPQLVYDNGLGLSIRTRIDIVDAGTASETVNQIFEGFALYAENQGAVMAGDVIWIDLPVSYTFFME